MASDSSNDQELALKKRARRRLVGAISLVLLMVIVLPMILQDRSALAPQETIKITIPAENVKKQIDSTVNDKEVSAEPQVDVVTNDTQVRTDPTLENTKEDVTNVKAQVAESSGKDNHKSGKMEMQLSENKGKVAQDSNTAVINSSETKVATEEKVKSTNSETFTIQVGVFSDMGNVKLLQEKLKQEGLTSKTENIATAKGEKIRLKAGVFKSRQEAAYALVKLQEDNLTGMVISNN